MFALRDRPVRSPPFTRFPESRPGTDDHRGRDGAELYTHDRWMQPRLLALTLVGLALVACGHPGIPVSPGDGQRATGAPKLLIRLDEGNDERGVGQHFADYLTDGSVIRLNAAGLHCIGDPGCGNLESNTLTAAGLAALHGVLDKDADLLGQPGAYVQRSRPNMGTGRADIKYTFVLERADGSRYAVSVPSLRSEDAAHWEPDPAIARLNALAEAMIDPMTLAGSDGLADRVWKTDPSTNVAVFVWFSDVSPFIAEQHMAAELKSIGWPFEGEPDSFGKSYPGTYGVNWRCGFVSRADIKTALAGWSAVGGDRLERDLTAGQAWGSEAMLWRDADPTMTLAVRVVPLLPVDSSASCIDAMTY